jgi:hypothetical protein
MGAWLARSPIVYAAAVARTAATDRAVGGVGGSTLQYADGLQPAPSLARALLDVAYTDALHARMWVWGRCSALGQACSFAAAGGGGAHIAAQHRWPYGTVRGR